MKSIKINQAKLRSCEALLRAAGAIHEGVAFPSFVYVSKKDYKTLSDNVKKEFKRLYPEIPMKSIDYSIGIHMLNLSPVVCNALKDGYILLDEERMDNQKERNELFFESRLAD